MDSMAQDQRLTTSDEGVEYIWQAMTARYGSKWTAQWATASELALAKKVWAMDVGKTKKSSVEKAFWKAKDTHPLWPPTSAEFGALCRGEFAEALGIPEFEVVFSNLMNNKYGVDSNMIYWGILQLSSKQVPVSEMRMWRENRSVPRVRKLYEECKRAMLFGVKYEPPMRIREQVAQKDNLLAQSISKGESDKNLQNNLKETGNHFLAQMRAGLADKTKAVV